MFDEMHDITSQLVTKWARHGSGHVIDANEDFTRLTFDTLALCTMNHRFNSYYSESMHPFLKAMTEFLKTSGDRARRVWFAQMFFDLKNRQYWGNIDLLRKTSLDVVQARKENPTDKQDLLSGMLRGIDPKTGERMSDDSVVDNMIMFLIAGHETTSGLLSFTLCYFLQNAAAYTEAQQEVGDVLGEDKTTVDHLAKLSFLNAENTLLGGRYYVKGSTPIIALPWMVHRDKTVYGDDAADFRPARMLDEAFNQRNEAFPNCWKPFGNGMRACIGRAFAWQQPLLVLAVLLQSFDLSMEDPSYRLRIKQTLTIKPDGFRVRARLREKWAAVRQRALGASTSHVAL